MPVYRRRPSSCGIGLRKPRSRGEGTRNACAGPRAPGDEWWDHCRNPACPDRHWARSCSPTHWQGGRWKGGPAGEREGGGWSKGGLARCCIFLTSVTLSHLRTPKIYYTPVSYAHSSPRFCRSMLPASVRPIQPRTVPHIAPIHPIVLF